jgi:hypothetical protein
MKKPRKPREPYDPGVSRVVSIRVHPETLKQLRHIAAERDLTVCSLLKIAAERLVSEHG